MVPKVPDYPGGLLGFSGAILTGACLGGLPPQDRPARWHEEGTLLRLFGIVLPGLTRTFEHLGRNYHLLRVPYHPQGEDPLNSRQSDTFCLPMCLKMVLEFLVDPYQPPMIRDNNKSWSVMEICRFVTHHPFTGCKVGPGFLNPLNDQLNFVRFQEMHMDTLDQVAAELAQERPVILFYNPLAYATGIAMGMGHAVVATGISDDYLFLNDPFEKSPRVVPRQRFEDAWTYEPTNAVVLRSKPRQERLQTETTIDRNLKVSETQPFPPETGVTPT